MLFLNHFDPSDIAPDVLIDREDEVLVVRSAFESSCSGPSRPSSTSRSSSRRVIVVGLETTVVFDVDRLLLLTTRPLRGHPRRRAARLPLLVDNVDELQHECWDEEARKNTQATVKRVLRLCDAPIATLLCMRTYFQSILPRAVGESHELEALPVERLLEIVDHRIGLESEAVQKVMRADPAQRVIAAFAKRAATPLALLTWVRWVARSKGGFAEPIDAQALKWRDASYVDFKRAIAATLKLFETKRTEGEDAVTRKDLAWAAVGDDEDAFRYLQTTELVPPARFLEPDALRARPEAPPGSRARAPDAGSSGQLLRRAPRRAQARAPVG